MRITLTVVTALVSLSPQLASADGPSPPVVAQAEPPPQQYAPPPQYPQQYPPQQYQQPPPPGYPPPPPGYPPPGYPPPAQYGQYPPGYAEHMMNSGHKLKVGGKVALGVGGGLLGLGIILVIAGEVTFVNNCIAGPTTACDNGGPLALIGAGAAAIAVGGTAMLAGIPLTIVGGIRERKGERLRMQGFSAVPLFANGRTNGAAFSAKLTF